MRKYKMVIFYLVMAGLAAGSVVLGYEVAPGVAEAIVEVILDIAGES